MKKPVAIFLALCMMLSASACSQSGGDESGSSNNNSSSGSGSTTEEREPVEITWWIRGTFPQNDQEKVFEAVNASLKEKLNTTINFQAVSSSEYADKFSVVLSSGEAYDICWAGGWPNVYLQGVSNGAYMALNDLLTEYAPKTYEAIPEEYWNAVSVNDNIYGVINYQIVARTGRTAIPKELYDEAPFDVDSVQGNLRALEPYLEVVSKNHPDYIIGLDTQNAGEYFGFEYLAGYNIPGAIDMNSDELKVFNQFESESYQEFYKMLKDWNDKGYMNGANQIAIADQNEYVKAAKTLIYTGGTMKPGGDIESNKSKGYECVYVPLSDAYVTTSNITATLSCIGVNSKNPERAMEVLEVINTDPEVYNTLIYGIEGEHYNKIDDTTIEFTEASANYNPGISWVVGNTFNGYITEEYSPTVWDETIELNNSATKSPALGFTFDTVPVKQEIAKCTNVYDEYVDLLSNGLATEDDYNTFISKLKASGSEKIIAEMQNQLDEWKANNK